MARSTFRRTLKLERLESRQVMSAGGPTAEAQYMLELINEARTNPGAAADRATSNPDADTQATMAHYNESLSEARQRIASSPVRQPVAWNDTLAATAQKQSQDQVDTGTQTHTGADGSDLNARLDRAGYTNRTSSGENAYAYAKSVDVAMRAFLIDWGVSSRGHYRNLMQPDASSDAIYSEVGIGIVQSNRAGFGPKVVTQDYGNRTDDKSYLLGVVYDDKDQNHFYTPGEGRGDVTIEAVNLDSGKKSSVNSWDAGGYQLALDPGSYKVTAKSGDRVVGSQQVKIGGSNIKVDYDLSQSPPAPVEAAPVVQTQAKTEPVATTATAPPPADQPKVETMKVETPKVETPKVETPKVEVKKEVKPVYDASWVTSYTSWEAPVK